MNNDNILIKILSTFNEGIFRNTDYDMKVSELVNKTLSYGGYDVSDCRFKVLTLSGNLDMCFIYDEVNTDRTKEVINVDDTRGTRIIVVIFVNNLLNNLRRLKPTETYRHCYKIYDNSNNFLGFAKHYEVIDGEVFIKEEDFDRELPKNRVYKIPCNRDYIMELISIFKIIVDMIKPNVPSNTITGRIYNIAPIVMALYSHKVTIGDLIYDDYMIRDYIDMINDCDLLEILDGKMLTV